MPRHACAHHFRSASSGLAKLEDKLRTLLLSMAPVRPPIAQHQITTWASLLAHRLEGASPRQLVEATQALSPAWTALAAWHRFGFAWQGGVVDYIGAARYECAAPGATFRDLGHYLGHGHTVLIRLIGPDAYLLPTAPDPYSVLKDPYMDIQVHKLRYETFVRDPHANYESLPNLAVALNAGLQEGGGHAWLPALRFLLEHNVPTTVTGYSREDATAALACMYAHDLRPRVIFGGRNPFGSLLGSSGNFESIWERSTEEVDAEDELVDFVRKAQSAALHGAERLDEPLFRGVNHAQQRRHNRKSLKRMPVTPSADLFDINPPLCNSYWFGFHGRE